TSSSPACHFPGDARSRRPPPPTAVAQAHPINAMDAARIEVVHGQTLVVAAEDDQRVRELRMVVSRPLEEEALALEPLELRGAVDDRRRKHRMCRLDLPRADEDIERFESGVERHPAGSVMPI